MKKFRFFFSVILSGLLLMPLSAQEALQSKWSEPDNVTFPSSFQYDDKNEIYYLISNDSENLYIQLVMVTDASEIRSLRYGLAVYVDPDGKEKKASSIKFLPSQTGGREGVQNRPDPADSQIGRIDQRKSMASGIKEVEISGFGNKKPLKTSESDLSGISWKVNIDDQVKLNYEISIPLEKLLTGKTMDAFSLGVESGFMNMEEMAAGRPGMQDRPQGQRPEGQRAEGQRPDGQRQQGAQTGGQRPGVQRQQGAQTGGNERPGGRRSPEEMEKRRQEMQKLTVPIKMWVKTVTLAKK